MKKFRFEFYELFSFQMHCILTSISSFVNNNRTISVSPLNTAQIKADLFK